MKYAVVETGGKQYVAREGQSIEVDLLAAEVGSSVTLDSILLAVDDSAVAVGKPAVEGAKVKARVEAHVKGPKIVVYRYIPKERFRRKKGHRQQYTRLAIEQISIPGMGRRKADEPEAAPAKPAPRKREAASGRATKPAKPAKPAKSAAKPPAGSGRKKPST